MNDKINDYFDICKVQDNYMYMSYAELNKSQKVYLDISKFGIVSDKLGHSKQNIVFPGRLISYEDVNGRTIQNHECNIVFPIKSFNNMLLRYGLYTNSIQDMLNHEPGIRMIFKRESKKKYTLQNYELCEH